MICARQLTRDVQAPRRMQHHHLPALEAQTHEAEVSHTRDQRRHQQPILAVPRDQEPDADRLHQDEHDTTESQRRRHVKGRPTEAVLRPQRDLCDAARTGNQDNNKNVVTGGLLFSRMSRDRVRNASVAADAHVKRHNTSGRVTVRAVLSVCARVCVPACTSPAGKSPT